MLTRTKITRIDNARGGRHYQVEGFPEPFPSVTTVLGVINKPALESGRDTSHMMPVVTSYSR